jgi:lipopolysaccharide biosynthesis glycosyltransferase
MAGGDQGLLNDFFSNWNRLSFVFNVAPAASYNYLPAYQRFKDSIRIVHYLGSDKPWRRVRVRSY